MRRWTGIAGIVWVVLAFVSRLVRGSVPDPSGDHAVDNVLERRHRRTGVELGDDARDGVVLRRRVQDDERLPMLGEHGAA